MKLLISKSQILNSRETVQIGEERDEQKESQCVEMKSVESAETKNQGSKWVYEVRDKKKEQPDCK